METSSGSYLVANSSGVFKIANLRRGPSENSFDAAILSDVKLSHSHFISNGASTSLRAPSVVRAPVSIPDVDRNVPAPRRMMLRRSDFDIHGLSARCPGYQWLVHRNGNCKNHTEECPKRVEEAIGQSEEKKHACRTTKSS